MRAVLKRFNHHSAAGTTWRRRRRSIAYIRRSDGRRSRRRRHPTDELLSHRMRVLSLGLSYHVAEMDGVVVGLCYAASYQPRPARRFNHGLWRLQQPVAATLAGFLIFGAVAFRIARQTRNRCVRATRTLGIDYGDDEMWRSLRLRRQDDTMFELLPIGNSDEPLHHEVESHMSITVFDRNADGTPNFTGTGVFSSGTQDIEF